MPTVHTQIWRGASLAIDRTENEIDGTVFRFSGPFTAHGMYASLSPDDFRNLFEAPPQEGYPRIHVFDLNEVPYMDSLGLGVLASHYVRCKNSGIRLSIIGASPRVQELLRLTKMDTVLPIVAL
jgi:anti-anti-sigma factor